MPSDISETAASSYCSSNSRRPWRTLFSGSSVCSYGIDFGLLVHSATIVSPIRRCQSMSKDNLPTNFESVQSFKSESIRALRNFKIIKTSKDSCFNARAVPKKELFTWFEIDYNPVTKEVIKKCGDQYKRGCNKGNSW